MEKALSYGIIPTITFFAHASFSTVGFEDFPIIVGSILAAPIAVKDKAFGGLSQSDSHQNGVTDQVGFHA